MFDILGVTVLLAVAALCVWLIARSRRAGNRIVKWVGLSASSLITLVVVLVLGAVSVGFYRINFPRYRASAADVKVAGTPEQVARGARLAFVCAACHSPSGDPPLVGHNFFTGAGAPPVGTMFAANLTPTGEIKDWSDGEIIRAIREGVHKNGRSLILMPSEVFHNMSDSDVHAVVAFLRSQPAAGDPTPPTKLNVLGALFIAMGLPTSAQPPITQPIIGPPEGTSAEYGKYLVSIAGCHVCHGEHLAGRAPGGQGPPAGPNLTMIVPKWGGDDFVRTMRTGVDPAKHNLTAEMPWQSISKFARDDDLAAMYAYLHGLSPVAGPDK